MWMASSDEEVEVTVEPDGQTVIGVKEGTVPTYRVEVAGVNLGQSEVSVRFKLSYDVFEKLRGIRAGTPMWVSFGSRP